MNDSEEYVSWVVLHKRMDMAGAPVFMSCLHCGGSATLVMPMTVEQFLDGAEKMREAHRDHSRPMPQMIQPPPAAGPIQ